MSMDGLGRVFVFGIMAETGDDVRAWLERGLVGYGGYRLGPDGEVLEKDDSASGLEWELLPPAAFAGQPWHRERHECPFVAPLTAYLRIVTVWNELIVHGDLLLGLVFLCRGVAVRLDDARVFQMVSRRQFDLGHNLGKFGFDDGDVFLSRHDEAYVDHVMDEITRVCVAAGLEVALSWMTTCHNPVRLSWFQPAGAEELYPAVWQVHDGQRRLVDSDRVLRDLVIEIWVRDFAVLKDEDWSMF